MKSYGLLGEKLGHSYSPQIHKILGGYDYRLIELKADELNSFMRSGGFDGINVTIPYKKAVIPYCDELSETARLTGSVNTVIRRPDGSLYGDNTDCAGFDVMLDAMKIPIGKKALILGNGGVSPSVKAVLSARGVSEIITVSRSGENNYVNLSRHYDSELIVNATPVGMYPNNYGSLIDLTRFDKCRGVVDLVYNPLRTRLVLDAMSLGITSCGGLYMLVAQAAKACELFTGRTISAERINEVYITLKGQTENVILIGMPGCGKSTTARALATLTGRRFLDCDDEIIKRAGMSIPEFFEKYGVAAFRELESEVLSDICRQSGAVIACGGGVVMRETNRDILRQNGKIVFLQRDIDSLPVDGRPISQSVSLHKLADMRLPLYNKWCDIKLAASSEEAAAIKIKEMLCL